MAKRDYPEVRSWLLQRLRFSEVPVTRDLLADELSDFAWHELALNWTPATAARRLREAFGRLEHEGHAVLSDGTGYRLAHTAEERALAARKIERMGLSCLRRAADIRGVSLGGELRQLELEFREAV